MPVGHTPSLVVDLTQHRNPRLLRASQRLLSPSRQAPTLALRDMEGRAAEDLEGALQRATWVAIVGTRTCTGLGQEIAHMLGLALADAGMLVISGGAIGIDRASHEGAMRAGAATTFAILPAPLAELYPRQNHDLFDAMLDAGGMVGAETQVDSSNAPRPRGVHHGKARFLTRNAWIAALADAVVVIEAGDPSGSLYTANTAHRMGIPVAAFPWSVTHPSGTGCNHLIASGTARLVTSTQDVLAWLARPQTFTQARNGATRRPRSQQGILLSTDAQVIARELRAAPRNVEELVRTTSCDATRVLRALAELELHGQIENLGARYTWRDLLA